MKGFKVAVLVRPVVLLCAVLLFLLAGPAQALADEGGSGSDLAWLLERADAALSGGRDDRVAPSKSDIAAFAKRFALLTQDEKETYLARLRSFFFASCQFCWVLLRNQGEFKQGPHERFADAPDVGIYWFKALEAHNKKFDPKATAAVRKVAGRAVASCSRDGCRGAGGSCSGMAQDAYREIAPFVGQAPDSVALSEATRVSNACQCGWAGCAMVNMWRR